jgi:dimethylamine/trimethylamine dehydrogenase
MRFSDYQTGLLLAYEEEVEGEAYFAGLAQHYEGRHRKVMLELAELERETALTLLPLIAKYALVPREQSELIAAGSTEAVSRSGTSWSTLIEGLVKTLPRFVEEFEAIEGLGPAEDLAILRLATAHEVALLQFALREKAGDGQSLEPIAEFRQLLKAATSP